MLIQTSINPFVHYLVTRKTKAMRLFPELGPDITLFSSDASSILAFLYYIIIYILVYYNVLLENNCNCPSVCMAGSV